MEHYTDVKRKRVKKERKRLISRKASRVVSLLFLFVAIVGTLIAIWFLIVPDSSAPVSTENRQSFGDPESLTELENFRRAYMAANLPSTVDQAMNSISISGRMEDDGGGQQEFSLIRMRPDLMRFTSSNEEVLMTTGVHNGKVWQRIVHNKMGERVQVLEGAKADMWRKQANFYDAIISCFNGDGEIDKIELTKHNGQDYLKVNIPSQSGAADKRILVDPITLHQAFQFVENSEGVVKETRYSDYRKIKGVSIPFMIENFTDDDFSDRIVIENASVNPGVVKSIFEMPQS